MLDHEVFCSKTSEHALRATPLGRVIVKFTVNHAVYNGLGRTLRRFDRDFDFDSQEWNCSKSNPPRASQNHSEIHCMLYPEGTRIRQI